MNIIITGGGFGNKGAQSMLFITVATLKKRYPKDDIILTTLGKENNLNFSFKVKHVSYLAYKTVVENKGYVYQLINRVKKEQTKAIDNLYKEARLQIDISGYALGNNWPEATVDYYLTCIECARKYNVPVYVLPQSFGPFEYKANGKTLNRIKQTMSYPKVVFAREPEGYKSLCEDFGLNNVIKSVDMVLRCKSADPTDVYKVVPKMNIPDIPENSVAVIPNKRNYVVGSSDVVDRYYLTAVNTALAYVKNVFLFYHSKEDAEICRELKQRFKENDNVILLDYDFTCFEYEMMVRKFDYIIASRYHAIVHALKNNVPCIAVGWATKYHELLALFDLQEYVFDVRNEVGENDFQESIAKMNATYKACSSRIGKIMEGIQQSDLFDCIG